MARGKLCPVCGTENTGGQPHRWHHAHRKSGLTVEQVAEMSRKTREANHLVRVVADAVDDAREPDKWDPGETRAAYHRAYYAKHLERRRMQARESKRKRTLGRKLRPLIDDLCNAVDLGRETARW
jgi:hypothetical protein